jgi:hypothetical protein
MSAQDHDKNNTGALDDIPDTPGVIAHPPLIYAGGLSAGLLVNYFFPVTFATYGRPSAWLAAD